MSKNAKVVMILAAGAGAIGLTTLVAALAYSAGKKKTKCPTTPECPDCPGCPSCPECPTTPVDPVVQYQLFPGILPAGKMMAQLYSSSVPTDEMRKYCDSSSTCQGFTNTSNPILVNQLETASTWAQGNGKKWNGPNGTYVRVDQSPFANSPYTYYPYAIMDTGKEVLTTSTGDVAALESLCDGMPDCVGFETNGNLLGTVTDPTTWKTKQDYDLYLKTAYVPKI